MLLVPFAKGLTSPKLPLLAGGSLPTDPLWQGALMGQKGDSSLANPWQGENQPRSCRGHSHEYVLGKKRPGALIQDV